MKKILIIGATSAMAESAARLWAQRGDYLFLVARNADKLGAVADDLRTRGGPRVVTHVMDVNDTAAHQSMLERAEAALGGVDVVLVAHGTLPDQQACARSVPLTLQEIGTNALSTIALLTLVANRFEARGSGLIAVISSVAGDRGRQSNYVYGSAKAMVSTFASGLRQRLARAGVAVLTIKPGFVDTPMTAAFPKGPLWARADEVGAAIVRRCDGAGGVAYLPRFWFWIMLVIKHVPEWLFKRMSL